MIQRDCTQFRKHMETDLDLILEDGEILIVSCKDDRKVVILSEEAYNNLLENIYIMENKANHDWLSESLKQLENGKTIAENEDLLKISEEFINRNREAYTWLAKGPED